MVCSMETSACAPNQLSRLCARAVCWSFRHETQKKLSELKGLIRQTLKGLIRQTLKGLIRQAPKGLLRQAGPQASSRTVLCCNSLTVMYMDLVLGVYSKALLQDSCSHQWPLRKFPHDGQLCCRHIRPNPYNDTL